MGTEVHSKSSFEGYYSMRDINEDSNSSSWPLFYGEKSASNGHYYNGFIPRIISDDKDALKQKMLEHEAIFKNQVHELHRLYIRQRDMMEEVKRKELNKHHNSIDASSSSSFLPSQKPDEDTHNHKWHMPTFPCSIPSIFGAEISNTNSPLSCSKGNNNNVNNSSKDCEILECRPSKVRKKLFDLELPPDENMDNEEHEGMQCKQVSEESSFRGSNGLADLNEPVHVDEPVVHGFGPSAKPQTGQFFDQRHEFSGRPGGVFNPILVEGKGNGRDWLSNTRETGNSRSNMNFTPGYSEISTRIQDHARFNQTHLPFPTSRASTSYPHVNSSNFGSSWEKMNGNSLTQKSTSFQKQPSFLSSPQSHVVVGDKWQQTNGYNNNNYNNYYNNNTPNGFYRGSSSGSKEPCARFPSAVVDDNRSQKIFGGSNFVDLMESTKGMDLNTVDETVNNDNSGSRRCNQPVFPWLQTKPAICKNEPPFVNNGKISVYENSRVSENGKIKKEIEHRGFDINVAWDEDPENKLIEEEDCNMGKENEKIKNHFDLNSCVTEDEEITVPESVKSLKRVIMEIDLEAPAVPEAEEEEEEAINEVKKLDEELAMVAAKALVAIFGQPKSTSDVAVCSDDEDKDRDRLLWFAEVIGSPGPGSSEVDEFEELTLKLEETDEQDYMPKPLAPDYFQEPDEAGPSAGPLRPRRGQARRGRPRRDFQRDILPGLVSLSRHEVTEDLQTFGGLMRATGYSWNVGLTRRNGTRGRRKSVVVTVEPPPPSATPPPLPPPPPPPPLPQLSEQLGNSEVVGLEERSLTGWGKTTRRPRRQRCAAGNSVAVPLT